MIQKNAAQSTCPVCLSSQVGKSSKMKVHITRNDSKEARKDKMFNFFIGYKYFRNMYLSSIQLDRVSLTMYYVPSNQVSLNASVPNTTPI